MYWAVALVGMFTAKRVSDITRPVVASSNGRIRSTAVFALLDIMCGTTSHIASKAVSIITNISCVF